MTWKPGQSGNPRGRPKNVRYVSEYLRDLSIYPESVLREIYDDPHYTAAIRTAAGMWIDSIKSESAKDQAKAREQTMDRLEGKPVQSHRVEQVQTKSPEELVQELRRKLNKPPLEISDNGADKGDQNGEAEEV